MKIALLSGAVKNAGDYLITMRCRELLTYVYPEVVIQTYNRNSKLTEQQIAEINNMDAIVLGGGPCYKANLYPQTIPLTDALYLLHKPIFVLGCGWYGRTTQSAEIFNYTFEERTKEFFLRAVHDTKILGCRDYYSVKALHANGIDNSLMTGCPAWYDIHMLDKRLTWKKNIKKIVVSDPAGIQYYAEQSLEVVKYLQKKYPDAELIYAFHRGINSDRGTKWLVDELKKMQIEIKDLSYGYEGFSIYNDCDLHVGHRVHAHIYNLSQRQATILIEEDARGAGVNETLGLWSIKAYARKGRVVIKPKCSYGKSISRTALNMFCLKEIDSYLTYLEQTSGALFNMAFAEMERYFDVMQKHILSLKKYV